MPLPPGADLTTNPDELINDPEIDVLVELMGGIDAPRTIIDRALDAGKHIVTANKALLAEEGLALFQKAACATRPVLPAPSPWWRPCAPAWPVTASRP